MVSFSISVPIGAYHDLLPACLESLARQDVDLRVSLLDASGDARVRALADQYQGLFAYRRHGPDKGQSDAIIEGWRRADGEVLGWLNADDFLYPGALKKVREKFASDDAIDVVTGHSAICDASGRMTGYHWAVAPAGETLRQGCCISQPSCFFKRSVTEAVGGLSAALHYTMDWDLWLRLLEAGAKFSFVDHPLSVVYWGEGTKTAGFNSARRDELEKIIRRHVQPAARMRVRRGFALRAFLDSIPSRKLALALESLLRRRSPIVFGVGPNGQLAPEATLHWMNYEVSERRRLEILLENGEAVDVTLIDRAGKIERGASGVSIILDVPAPVGGEISLRLVTRANAKARLVSCGWAQDAENSRTRSAAISL